MINETCIRQESLLLDLRNVVRVVSGYIFLCAWQTIDGTERDVILSLTLDTFVSKNKYNKT